MRRRGQLVFFIDDNITSNLDQAKELMRAIMPLKLRWISQSAINVAYDDEALDLMRRSGCQGVLVGFESLDPQTLKQMNKGFNLMRGGPGEALANFRRHGLRIYGTFIFGYDHDTPETFDLDRRIRQAAGLVDRRVQSHHAVSGNAVVPADGTGRTTAVRRLVAGRSLSIQHDSVSTAADQSARVGGPLCRGAAEFLLVAEHPSPCDASRQLS